MFPFLVLVACSQKLKILGRKIVLKDAFPAPQEQQDFLTKF
jgi:hypothetical protein